MGGYRAPSEYRSVRNLWHVNFGDLRNKEDLPYDQGAAINYWVTVLLGS